MLQRTRSVSRTRVVVALAIFALPAFGAGGLTKSASAQDPNYTLSIADQSVLPGGAFSIPVNLNSLAGGPLGGWSYGVCHDPAALSIESVVSGAMVIAVTGSPPAFESFELLPNGHAIGVVFFGPGQDALPPSNGPLTIGTYTHSLAVSESTTLTICDTLGLPPVEISLVFNGQTIAPQTTSGTITVIDLFPWIRGDANDDGLVNLADGVFLLNELFQGGAQGTCFAAKDANADEAVDAADAIFIFNALFLDGPPPSAPYPDCEALPADCAFQSSCF